MLQHIHIESMYTTAFSRPLLCLRMIARLVGVVLVVACPKSAFIPKLLRGAGHTQMEVVVLSVAKEHETANHVYECFLLSAHVSCDSMIEWNLRTPRRRVLARHVSERIPGEETRSFRFWGSAAWELFVEGDDFLHARGICGAANGLFIKLSVSRFFCRQFGVAIGNVGRHSEPGLGLREVLREEVEGLGLGTHIRRGHLYSSRQH